MENIWKHFTDTHEPLISPAIITMKGFLFIIGGLVGQTNCLNRVFFRLHNFNCFFFKFIYSIQFL